MPFAQKVPPPFVDCEQGRQGIARSGKRDSNIVYHNSGFCLFKILLRLFRGARMRDDASDAKWIITKPLIEHKRETAIDKKRTALAGDNGRVRLSVERCCGYRKWVTVLPL